jgi:hypothetical protein
VRLSKQLQGPSQEEIEDRLVQLALGAEKDADRLKALELLAKIKGIIKHGNAPKEKDFTEILIGSHTTKEEREKRDAGGDGS